MTIIIDNADVLIERTPAPTNHTLSLLPEIYVERGTKADWDLLHELHYKAENLPFGPKFYRCVLRGQTIGVGVMTVSSAISSGRNKAFTHLRPNQGGMDTKLINKYRLNWINDNATTNSRLVLDTMYRGAGIAYRMQNLMMRMSGARIVEFQSSMSKFNPFAGKAGVRFVKPEPSQKYEAGLVFFRRWFDSIPSDYVGVMEELEAMPASVREKCVKEMRDFYFRNSSREKSGNKRFDARERIDGYATGWLLKQIQQLVFASPLYGVYQNPDFGRELPERISLLEFDVQPVDAPLTLYRTVGAA
jgi:ABC-type ATPase with predicted acetyltransferase domain